MAIPGKLILCGFQDENYYYFGTASAGSYRIPKNEFGKSEPEFLFGGIITGFIVDSEGGYWYSLYDDGVVYIPWPSATIIDKSDGTHSSNITHVSFRKGIIFLGHPEQAFTSIGEYSVRVHQNNILYGMEDIPNMGWVFLGKYSGRVKSSDNLHYEGIEASLHYNKFIYNSLFHVIVNDTLIVSGTNGIARINSQAMSAPGYFLTDKNINSMVVINKSKILTATNSGVYWFEKDTLIQVNKHDSAFNSAVSRLCVIEGEHYLMASKTSGLYECKGDKIIRRITSQNGLLSDQIRCITVTKNGNYWIGTNKGAQLLSPAFRELKIINSSHGLPGNEVNFITESGDTVYMATDLGLLKFSYSSMFSVRESYPVFITGISTNTQNFRFSEFREIDLPSTSNTINIQFLTISKRGSGSLLYRYRLNGGGWSVTSNTSIDLVNLFPDNYLLEIQSRVLGYDWGPSSKLTFTVLAPFWQQLWFRILLLVLGGLLLFLIYCFLRRRQITKENQRLEFTRQLEQLRLQALQAQMNPYFMFNVMGSIQHFILNNDAVNASSYLTRFSRLIRNVLEQSSAERINLEQELETLRLYLQLEELRMERFSYEIQVSDNVSAGSYLIPPMIIQPFIENAIWHGLMNKAGERKIIVRVYLSEQEQLIVEVEDNGIGRKAAALIKTKSNKLHNSKAMELIEKRIDALKYLYQQQISVQIIDLFTDTGEAAGTKSQIIVGKL